MGKALSYMMMGALGTSAMWLLIKNRDEITRAMRRMKRENQRMMEKFKAMF